MIGIVDYRAGNLTQRRKTGGHRESYPYGKVSGVLL
jgi:hypothetical protein